jgi:hypothetical protein
MMAEKGAIVVVVMCQWSWRLLLVERGRRRWSLRPAPPIADSQLLLLKVFNKEAQRDKTTRKHSGDQRDYSDKRTTILDSYY